MSRSPTVAITQSASKQRVSIYDRRIIRPRTRPDFSLRSHPNGWADRSVGDDTVREIYDLMKWGPTSANSSPARFVWVHSADGKATLAGLAAELNKPKVLKAPVTVIIGHDLDFAGGLRKLLLHNVEVMQKYFAQPGAAEVTAMRNGTLQGAYLIVAARA